MNNKGSNCHSGTVAEFSTGSVMGHILCRLKSVVSVKPDFREKNLGQKWTKYAQIRLETKGFSPFLQVKTILICCQHMW